MSNQIQVKSNHIADVNDMIAKRNNRIERFFKELDIPIRLIGNKNKPAIIYNNMVSLSIFVHNFNLNFTDKPHRGKIIKTVKLTHDIKEKREDIINLLKIYPHQAVYCLKLANSPLFLAGYNHLDKKNCLDRYPVFAKHQYKIYFKTSHANEIINELSKDGYTLEIHKQFLNNSHDIIALEDDH